MYDRTIGQNRGVNQVEQRIARLEAALEELRQENRKLREDLQELRLQLADQQELDPAVPMHMQRKVPARWSVVALAVALVAVPVLAFSVWHTSALWSTTIGAVNGLILYMVGPGVWRLLMEGLFRAIPGVLFGQAARVAVDKYRQKRTAR